MASRKRKLPALIRRERLANQHAFLRGFACALAAVNRNFDQPGIVNSTMVMSGVSIEHLQDAKTEDYDLDEIRNCL